MEEILKVAKQESGNTKIVISSVVTRADQTGIKKKVSKLNDKSKTFCHDNGIKLIDHSNINDDCLVIHVIHVSKCMLNLDLLVKLDANLHTFECKRLWPKFTGGLPSEVVTAQ